MIFIDDFRFDSGALFFFLPLFDRISDDFTNQSVIVYLAFTHNITGKRTGAEPLVYLVT